MNQIETYKMPKIDFKLINVVDVRVHPTQEREGYQAFMCTGNDFDRMVIDHTSMIEHAIIYSAEQSIPMETWYKTTLHCISGFVERYGRMPTMDDKIQIIATNYFTVKPLHNRVHIQSLLDFNVL